MMFTFGRPLNTPRKGGSPSTLKDAKYCSRLGRSRQLKDSLHAGDVSVSSQGSCLPPGARPVRPSTTARSCRKVQDSVAGNAHFRSPEVAGNCRKLPCMLQNSFAGKCRKRVGLWAVVFGRCCQLCYLFCVVWTKRLRRRAIHSGLSRKHYDLLEDFRVRAMALSWGYLVAALMFQVVGEL